ncbi:MAG: YegS/Rv2252/BmrU family lipid kinase [Idiomarina sp.]|nr:YegS/Rv2252/BmrU family lipid kinase [Idiomarina sp.]
MNNFNYLLLINPKVRHRRIIAAIERRVAELGGEIVRCTMSPDVSQTCADVKRILKSQPNIYNALVVGGDGSLHQAANCFAHTEINLGMIPSGTGNDFARHWYDKSAGFEQMLEGALRGSPIVIDLGKINDRWFINVAGVGFDGDLIQRIASRKSLLPKLRYMIAALRQLFRYQGRKLQLTLDTGAQTYERSLLFVIANSPFYGAGMRIAPQASPTSGGLSWVQIDDSRLLTKLKAFTSIYNGSHLAHPSVTSGHLKHLSIETPNLAIQLDGEPFGTTPLHCSVDVKALKLRKPLN